MYNIVFSKNRIMQLRAHLESFQYYSGATSYNTTVICPKSEEYETLKQEQQFRSLDFKYEEVQDSHLSPFEYTLNKVIEKFAYGDDIILFAVDDLIYFREFNINICNELYNHPDAIGFTFRLGTNIRPYHQSWNESKDPRFIKFNWTNKPSHFGYPFEVSCSAYRVSLIREILKEFIGRIRIPNDLEGLGVQYVMKTKRNAQPYYLMCNSPSFAACLDWNRVQDIYPNRIQGGTDLSSENLLDLYKKGYRINWQSYHHLEPKDCFIGNLEAILTKQK